MNTFQIHAVSKVNNSFMRSLGAPLNLGLSKVPQTLEERERESGQKCPVVMGDVTTARLRRIPPIPAFTQPHHLARVYHNKSPQPGLL